HGEGEGKQQNVAILAVSGGADDEALQTITEREEQRREPERCEVGIEPEQPVGKKRREHGGGEQRAMREIDDVQDTIDQRQAKRDQPIPRPGQKSVEDGGNENDRRQHRRAGGDGGARRLEAVQAGGMGNTGFAVANVCGKITWMSLPSTWVLTGAAP